MATPIARKTNGNPNKPYRAGYTIPRAGKTFTHLLPGRASYFATAAEAIAFAASYIERVEENSRKFQARKAG